jgi:hypothetical protein
MRRVFILSSPFLAVAVGLVLFHAAARAVAERPASEKTIGADQAIRAPAQNTQIPPPPMRVNLPERKEAPATDSVKPILPQPPEPFGLQASWLPLEEATPAAGMTAPTTPEVVTAGPQSIEPAFTGRCADPSSNAFELDAQDSATIEEILRIRQMLEFNPFKGTVIEEGLPRHIVELGRGAAPLPSNCPSGDDEFVAALKKITLDEREAAQTIEIPAQFDPYASDSDSSEDFTPAEMPPSSDDELFGEANEVELVAALRAACRALESRANHHEDLSDFERADDLRALADHLRRESRRK